MIGVAYKKFDATPALTPEALENELTFGGLVGIIDPPREESAHAVRVAKEAGIKTVMITGDHLATAKAIAEQIGILDSNTKIMNGSEFALYIGRRTCRDHRRLPRVRTHLSRR